MARYDDIRNGNNPGVYDIVKEYDWTSVPRTSDLRNEAPSAFITAYELQYSQLRSFIDGYMNILSPQNNAGSYGDSKNPGLDFYKGLYTVKNNAIARLNFPFFEDSFRSFSTEFADTFSPISQRGAQMFGGKEIQGLGAAGESLAGGGVAAVNALASFGDTGNSGDQSLADKIAKTVSGAATGVTKALGLNPGMQTIGTPGSYIETPKFYQYSNTDNGLQIGFTLSNTLEDDSIDKNFKFICDFTKMNRPYRYGPIGMDFPAIYNLVVPGLRYIQWAYLENFEVSLLGNRRRIGTRVIPEAYVCNFTFRSLTVEPANFVEEICDNRDAFGDFDRYSANQAKEEEGFQKGKYQRERTLNKRSDLARAIRTGDQLPNQQPDIPFVGPPVPGPIGVGPARILGANQPPTPANLAAAGLGNSSSVFTSRTEIINGEVVTVFDESTTSTVSPQEVRERQFAATDFNDLYNFGSAQANDQTSFNQTDIGRVVNQQLNDEPDIPFVGPPAPSQQQREAINQRVKQPDSEQLDAVLKYLNK